MDPGEEHTNMRAMILLLVACAAQGSAGIEANERLAESASRRGDWAAAADLWHRVYLADRFENPRACLETARALSELGDPDSAEALLRDGIRRSPENSALHELHGVVLEETGYRRAAEAAYSKALELQPSLIHALAGLGRVRLQLGLETSAIPPLQRLVDLDPTPEALHLLTKAALAANDYVVAYDTYLHMFDMVEGTLEELLDAAKLGLKPSLRSARRASPLICEAWLARVLEADPQCTRAHILLGAYRQLAGDDEAAVRHLTRACETDPASTEAFLDLAELYMRLAEVEIARTFLDHASEIVEDEAARTRLSTLLSRADELGARSD